MIFHPASISGVFLISPERHEDDRGSFERAFCREEFSRHGLATEFVQANISFNHSAGTVRGMHFQRRPHTETKLVRCTAGAVYDVVVDVRRDSPTRGLWFGAELSVSNGIAMYVPEGFAHGYQTLTENAAVHYLVTAPYQRGSERGLSPKDPVIAIKWPLQITLISQKDLAWATFDEDCRP